MEQEGKKYNRGFSLIEVIVGAAVFVTIAFSAYQAYRATLSVVSLSRIKVTATALANEQFEIMRNLPYADIGIVGGLPSGKIPATQTLTRDDKEFTVKTTIRNIDDPFDGTIGGSPNDTSPADYKMAEVEISCPPCRNFSPFQLTTNIAPKNLESSSTNGALFVKVYDATGLPITEADVHIENNQTSPVLVIDDVTNNDGVLQIVDAPPGTEAYEITVSKSGYSTERTYATGDPENPNPSKTHATVLVQQLTEISFIIDKVSTLEIQSVDTTCQATANIDLTLTGEKLIGTEPNVHKNEITDNTGATGEITISDLEWDTYTLAINDSVYSLAGAIPATNFSINQDATQNLKIVLASTTPKKLLLSIKDAVTNLPLSDVSAHLTGTDYDSTLITGRGFLRQTDWSDGAGQEKLTDPEKYFDSDEQIEISDPIGELHLKKVLDEYSTSGWLMSSTFDTGSASNFHQIFWQPQSQPTETGENSVRLQIASNNDNSTWNFIGPDGTNGTFYTLSNQDISLHNGNRYLRYKVFLQTTDTTKTPTISDIYFTFTSDCVPPGQVFFTGLLLNSYNLSLEKVGYESYTGTVNTTSDWQEYEIILTP